jgi:hypothetical protein
MGVLLRMGLVYGNKPDPVFLRSSPPGYRRLSNIRIEDEYREAV